MLGEYHAMRAMAKADATLGGHAEQQTLEHFAAKHALSPPRSWRREEHHEELDSRLKLT